MDITQLYSLTLNYRRYSTRPESALINEHFLENVAMKLEPLNSVTTPTVLNNGDSGWAQFTGWAQFKRAPFVFQAFFLVAGLSTGANTVFPWTPFFGKSTMFVVNELPNDAVPLGVCYLSLFNFWPARIHFYFVPLWFMGQSLASWTGFTPHPTLFTNP